MWNATISNILLRRVESKAEKKNINTDIYESSWYRYHDAGELVHHGTQKVSAQNVITN